ncbi:MAG: sulfatase-like hydrolase/transferase [Candidatus Omnitrophica bacterium]|nr:sulfatase-like hydrolase/transferase [Candidatus Omnitrophota bacterium]
MKKIVVLMLIVLVMAVVYFSGAGDFGDLFNNKRSLNILFITIDALRKDHLTCYGYKKDITPNIDRLAREGVIFTQAISQGSSTHYSVPSFLSSIYVRIPQLKNRFYPPTNTNLPEILKEKGYFVGIMGANAVYPYDQTKLDLCENIDDIQAEELTRRVVEFLRKEQDKPFFFWIHYWDVHTPRLSLAEAGGDKILQYDTGLILADEHVGILLRELERLNLDKNTLVILSADHGEGLGEHGSWSHGGIVWDEVLRVPLIFKCPGVIPKQRRFDNQVGLIDIGPTILDILRLDKSEEMEGSSLFPLILNKQFIHCPYIFSEHYQDEFKPGFDRYICSVRTQDWKLIRIRVSGSEELEYMLYNLKKDPKELTNLAEVEKRQFEFLKQRLEDWLKQKRTIVKLDEEIAKDKAKETVERLRRLGYMQ